MCPSASMSVCDHVCSVRVCAGTLHLNVCECLHPAWAVSAFICSYHVHTGCGVSLVCACAGPHESWRSTLFRLGPAVQRLSLQALSESSTRASYVSVHTLSWRPTQAHAGEVDGPGGGPDGVQNGSE